MAERANVTTLKEYYEETGAESFLYTQLKEYTKNKKVLDIACGSGMGSYIIAQNAKQVIGADLSHKTIQKNKHIRQNNLTFVQANMLNLPFKNETFDVIVSLETIEHTGHTQKYLEEMKRILKPNGTFIISTPNNGYEKRIKTKFSKWEYHVFEFAQLELQNELKKHFVIQHFLGKSRKGYDFETRQLTPTPTWDAYFYMRIIPFLSEHAPVFIKKIHRKMFETSSNINEYYISKKLENIKKSLNFFVIMKKKSVGSAEP